LKSKHKLVKLDEFLKTEFPGVRDLLIEEVDGGYRLFDKYELKQVSSEWGVTVGSSTILLSSTPIAVAWSVLHNAGDYFAAAKVLTYDGRVTRYRTECQEYKTLIAGSKSVDTKDTLRAKWSEARYRETQAVETLNKYLTLAKYKQAKGFNNETARPISKKQFRKHR